MEEPQWMLGMISRKLVIKGCTAGKKPKGLGKWKA